MGKSTMFCGKCKCDRLTTWHSGPGPGAAYYTCDTCGHEISVVRDLMQNLGSALKKLGGAIAHEAGESMYSDGYRDRARGLPKDPIKWISPLYVQGWEAAEADANRR